MTNPWNPEKEVDLQLAQKIIEQQFPELMPLTIEYVAKGFESTVFLVNKKYGFRFPRRTVSVGYLEQEIRILPVLAQYLTVSLAKPLFYGKPTKLFNWAFAGFSFLEGRGAECFSLNNVERTYFF